MNVRQYEAALLRALGKLLHRREYEAALELALAAGETSLARQFVTQAGWTLLFRREWRRLPEVLSLVPHEDRDSVALAWALEANRLPHDIDQSLSGEARSAKEAALLARCAFMFDDLPRARESARTALAQFDDDREPAYAWTQITLASVHLGEGALDVADPLLCEALKRADRDELPRLALAAHHQRALIAVERGETAAARRHLTDLLTLATEQGLTDDQTCDSAARALAWLHVACGFSDDAQAALLPGRAAASRLGERWTLPYSVLETAIDLAAGKIEQAAARFADIGRRLDDAFCCEKWRHEASFVELWLANRRQDKISRTFAAPGLPAADATLHQLRTAVLHAGAALMHGQPWPAPLLDALAGQLTARGLCLLAQRIRLTRALGDAAAQPELLLSHLRWSAPRSYLLDYLWLGPQCLAPLEHIVRSEQLAREPLVLAHARTAIQKLLAPLPTAIAFEASPPNGLTPQEWRVLQLVANEYTNAQIATRLFVSEATVKTHINHVYSKLGIRRRSEAILRARALSTPTNPPGR